MSDYGNALKMDAQGNAYVGGSNTAAIYIAKVNPAGTTVWQNSFGTAGAVADIAIDSNSDIVLTGYFYATVNFGGSSLTSLGGYDGFIAKFTKDGSHIWSKRFGSAYGADFAGDEGGLGI